MNNKFFSPSFKLERKTRALNPALWGFVGLISLFSVGGFVWIFHLMICSILDVESTFISDSFLFEGFIIIVFALMAGIGLYKFINYLLHSYKFEDNKIIKGRIIKPKKIKGIDLALDTALTTNMIKNITNSKKVYYGNTVMNINNILTLIKLNTNQQFVNEFFDTDIYKKKIYNNPQLLKETKYTLIYICEGNKKLVIPKIYEGMNIKIDSNRESPLISRIFKKSLIVFSIFFLFSMLDLFIGINNNSKYISNINNTCKTIQTNLNNYGYSMTRDCNFEKKVSDYRYSIIKYNIDKQGNIVDVDLDLFYDLSSYSDSELKYIISTLNTTFSEYEINHFIEQVNSCINGNCSYGKIEYNNDALTIGSSNGLVNIYNY